MPVRRRFVNIRPTGKLVTVRRICQKIRPTGKELKLNRNECVIGQGSYIPYITWNNREQLKIGGEPLTQLELIL